ncbi:MAG: acetyl-CoA C-acetyltransferase [Bacteroidales bacterium]|nr:acetyl-CoA C-acetyltransferase [Bacteroidales bacterium]MDD3988548.1 acetyl-CoA C-acetyltransferase [Bacteroidales bacterium]
MKKVYIVAARRTAIGKFMGSLSPFSPGELGAIVIKEVVKDAGIEPGWVDTVIAGNILSAGQMQGVARQCSIKAGIPAEVPAYSINMVCGSGMKSVMNGYAGILSGMADIVVAGGTESMTNSGFILPSNLRSGAKMGNFQAVDHMVCDGLTDAFNNYHMGITAENVAEKYSISREEQDRFAFSSQQKAIRSVDGGAFAKEIVPVEIVTKKETTVFDKDEFPNRGTSFEKLGTLRPAFKKDGTVTAGNASGINDGASFTVICSEDAVKKYNLKPLAEIVSVGQGGVDPSIMGMGPVPAVRMALKNAGLKLSNIDLVELNEAFAAQSLGVIKELKKEHNVTQDWFDQRCNINGGAIALGHPIGASGNRIIVTLIHEMEAHKKELGLASLCIGGGMGTAIIIKKI